MNSAQKLTIQLIRYEIAGIPVDTALMEEVNDDVIASVYRIASEQELSYVVANALSKLGLLSGDAKEAFFTEQLVTVYRLEMLRHELASISQIFEDAGISFIPLKGSVIRNYYPKPEMRISCDTDILIHPEDLERAGELLCSKLNYKFEHKGSHDVAYESESGAELELHFRLFENDGIEKDILDRVWDYAVPCDGYAYRLELRPEFFVFYHIFHMAKHIRNGGCGLRPFLDLWIIENKFPYDKEKLSKLLCEAGLERFFEVAHKTAMMWYGTQESDDMTELLEEYIFNAGIYGNFENMAAVSVVRSGGKVKALMGRIFLPHKLLKHQFPVLEKYPVLTPFYEVKRWVRIIFKDKAKNQMEIARHNNSLSDEKRQKMEKLVDYLGIR